MSLSKSKTRELKFRHSWTLDPLSFVRERRVLRNSVFSVEGYDGLKWSLELHPHGSNERTEDCISLFLFLNSVDKDKAQARFKFSVLNAKRKEIRSLLDEKPFFYALGNGVGFYIFVERNQLFNSADECPGEELTVLCEVTVALESAITPSQTRPIMPDVAECVSPVSVSGPRCGRNDCGNETPGVAEELHDLVCTRSLPDSMKHLDKTCFTAWASALIVAHQKWNLCVLGRISWRKSFGVSAADASTFFENYIAILLYDPIPQCAQWYCVVEALQNYHRLSYRLGEETTAPIWNSLERWLLDNNLASVIDRRELEEFFLLLLASFMDGKGGTLASVYDEWRCGLKASYTYGAKDAVADGGFPRSRGYALVRELLRRVQIQGAPFLNCFLPTSLAVIVASTVWSADLDLSLDDVFELTLSTRSDVYDPTQGWQKAYVSYHEQLEERCRRNATSGSSGLSDYQPSASASLSRATTPEDPETQTRTLGSCDENEGIIPPSKRIRSTSDVSDALCDTERANSNSAEVNLIRPSSEKAKPPDDLRVVDVVFGPIESGDRALRILIGERNPLHKKVKPGAPGALVDAVQSALEPGPSRAENVEPRHERAPQIDRDADDNGNKRRADRVEDETIPPEESEVPPSLTHVISIKNGRIQFKEPFAEWWKSLAECARPEWAQEESTERQNKAFVVDGNFRPGRNEHRLRTTVWNFVRHMMMGRKPKKFRTFDRNQIEFRCDVAFTKLFCLAAADSIERDLKRVLLPRGTVLEKKGRLYRAACWFCPTLKTCKVELEKSYRNSRTHLRIAHKSMRNIEAIRRPQDKFDVLLQPTLIQFLLTIQEAIMNSVNLKRVLSLRGRPLRLNPDSKSPDVSMEN